jgi:RimK family alpha-L-glutamate ligase
MAIVRRCREGIVAVVGWPQETNERLAREWAGLGIRATLLSPPEAGVLLRPSDVAVGRLDVLGTLDGVQPGIDVLDELDARGTRVVNGRSALLDAHDKLRTARLLESAGLPHPATAHARSVDDVLGLGLPLVVKPRFGSWGSDVVRCTTIGELAATFDRFASRPWFRRHGALVQSLIPSPGFDLRVVVANLCVVGAIERVARPGEWRTNVALGGTRRAVDLPESARELATAAAALVAGESLVGVDLLPVEGGYVVLELNGAVEFDRTYDLDGSNVFAAAARALRLDDGNLTASGDRGRTRPRGRRGRRRRTTGRPRTPGSSLDS